MNLQKIADIQLMEITAKINPEKVEGVFEFQSKAGTKKAVTVIEDGERKSYIFGSHGLIAVTDTSIFDYQMKDEEEKFEDTLEFLSQNRKYEVLDNEFQKLMLTTLGEEYYKELDKIYSQTISSLETKLQGIEKEIARSEMLKQNQSNSKANYMDELYEKKDKASKILQFARVLDLRFYENHIGPITESSI